MIDLSDCILLGEITRTHGIHGQVAVRINNLGFDDILEMESVFLEIDGLPVPFFISEYSEKSIDVLLLTFEDIQHENKAKELVGYNVYIPSQQLKPQTNSIEQNDSMLGYVVVDEKYGKLGILDDILDFQVNPLFKILDKKKEILVPIQHEFIQGVDHKKRIIYLRTPEGLTDLYR